MEHVRHKLMTSDREKISSLSAELNALIRYYEGQLPAGDMHVLLITDTWLARQAANLIKEWLLRLNLAVQIQSIEGLQTADFARFQVAMADLVQWVHKDVLPYSESGYHIVFNLTGGFKSIQGFLQTLGIFYADEVIYIFETGTELFRLPKIPVKLIPGEVIRENLNLFRRMDLSLPVRNLEKIPQVMYLQMDHEIMLSDYGELIFNQSKKELYGQQLWPAPCEKLVFSDAFIKSAQHLNKSRLQKVNERIDDLARYLCSGNKANLNRLDFKPIKGNVMGISTHEIDAWADQDARRIYGHFENDAFILDELGKALH